MQAVNDPTMFKHPFTMVIAGPTGSGKTQWVKKLLKDLNSLITPIPQEVIWCYGIWQPEYDNIYGVRFLEGVPDTEQWADQIPRLIILDDLMSEADQRVTKLFTKGSHHRNISVVFIVQNLFGKNKELRTISLNSHYIVVFKNPRDASQINHLAKQMYPLHTKYVFEAFKDATTSPYGYLMFDLRQETPDHMRLRTDVFPSTPNYQVVYLKK